MQFQDLISPKLNWDILILQSFSVYCHLSNFLVFLVVSCLACAYCLIWHVQFIPYTMSRAWCKTIVTSYIKWGSYNSFASRPQCILSTAVFVKHEQLLLNIWHDHLTPHCLVVDVEHERRPGDVFDGRTAGFPGPGSRQPWHHPGPAAASPGTCRVRTIATIVKDCK